MKKLAGILLFVLFTFASLNAQNTEWNFDKAHSKIQFTVSHLVISSVTGEFNEFDGTVKTNGDDFSNSKISFVVKTNSINTDNEKRDNHLKSDDFFNAAQYPEIKFIGKEMKKVGENKYKLIGDFTIRNVTKEIDLDVTKGGIINDPWGNKVAAFTIDGTINRFDYNLKWNKLLEVGGAVVGEDVDIHCKVELIQSKDEA